MIHAITPTRDQWTVLEELGIVKERLGFDGLVILHPDVVAQAQADGLDIYDSDGYDFLGHADLLVDVVTTGGHGYVCYLREQLEKQR